jgi:hypothetical protein
MATYETQWANPNEPMLGSRKSPRKQVFKNPIVIKHRLLLEPTIARRRLQSKRDQESKRMAMARFPHLRQEGNEKEKTTNSSTVTKKVNAKENDKATRTAPQTPTRESSEVTPPTTPDAVGNMSHSDTVSKKEKSEKNSRKKYPKSTRNPSYEPFEAKLDFTSHVLSNLRYAKIMGRLQAGPYPSRGQTSALYTSSNPITEALQLSRSLLVLSDISRSTTSCCEAETLLDVVRVERSKFLKVRGVLVNQLLSATDVATIVASARLLKQLYGPRQMDSSTSLLLSNAENSGKKLMKELLMESFIKPPMLGGLGISPSKASLMISHIIYCLGASLGAVDISLDILIPLGFSLNDAVAFTPLLRLLGDSIQEKTFCLRSLLRMSPTLGLLNAPQSHLIL